MTEIVWKPIPGWPGYFASDTGEIGSGKVKEGNQWVNKDHPVKTLKPSSDAGGYKTLVLSLDGVTSSHTVHSLVAKAFLGEKTRPHHVVRFKDGNKSNSSAGNLVYAKRGGPSKGVGLIKESDVVAIREAFARDKSIVEQLASEHKVSETTIWRLVYGHTYKHIGGPIGAATYTSSDSEYINDKDVRRMRRLRSEGHTYTSLASQFGISLSTASRICRGHRRREAGGHIVS